MANEAKAPKRTWWERLSWPQVVFLAVLIAGAVLAGVLVPVEKLETIPWDRALGLVLLIAGVAGVAGTKPALDLTGLLGPRRVPPSSESEPPAPRRPERTGREGFVDLEALFGICGLAALALVAASLFGGCGGGPLQGAVRSVSYSRIFLNLAKTVEEEAIATLRDGCAGDAACIEDLVRTAEIVGDVHDAAVAVLEGWESGVRAAIDVDAGDDVIAAVVRGGAGVAEQLVAVANIILEHLEVELPPAVRTILATVQALVRALAQPPGDGARVEAERWLLGLA